MSRPSAQKLPRGQIGRWLLLLRQVHARVPARSFSSLIFFSSVDQNLWSLVAVCVTNCQVSSILQKWSRASRPRWRYCSQCRKTVSAHHFSRHLRSHEIYGAAPSAGQSSASTTSPRASSAAPSSFRRHAAPVVPVARACMGRALELLRLEMSREISEHRQGRRFPGASLGTRQRSSSRTSALSRRSRVAERGSSRSEPVYRIPRVARSPTRTSRASPSVTCRPPQSREGTAPSRPRSPPNLGARSSSERSQSRLSTWPARRRRPTGLSALRQVSRRPASAGHRSSESSRPSVQRRSLADVRRRREQLERDLSRLKERERHLRSHHHL